MPGEPSSTSPGGCYSRQAHPPAGSGPHGRIGQEATGHASFQDCRGGFFLREWHRYWFARVGLALHLLANANRPASFQRRRRRASCFNRSKYRRSPGLSCAGVYRLRSAALVPCILSSRENRCLCMGSSSPKPAYTRFWHPLDLNSKRNCGMKITQFMLIICG